MQKAHLGRSMLEMLLVLVIMGVIAAGGVWGVEYAIDMYTKNQVEQEVIVQMSSLRTRTRPLSSSKVNERKVKGKYVKSQTIGNGKITLTVGELSEGVCKALTEADQQEMEEQKGFRVAFPEGTNECDEENTLNFVSALRTTSDKCAKYSIVHKCSGEDEYEDGCLVTERIYCADGQQCRCSGGDCYCEWTSQACSTGQKLINNRCVDCGVAGCLAYSDGCTCSACQLGYKRVNGRCVPPKCEYQKGCIGYDADCNCLGCDKEYIESNGLCCEEKTNCLAYGDDCNCTECESGFKVEEGVCVACHLDTCQTFNSTCGCTECISGYAVSETNGCCSVIEQCTGGYKNNCQCKGCATGYSRSRYNEKCCTKVDHCGTYKADGDGTDTNCTCIGCQSGFFLNSANTCCPESSEVDGCTAYDGNCKCTSCSSNDETHMPRRANSDGTACCDIKDHCTTYDSNCTCTACDTGYHPGGSGGGCIECGIYNCSRYEENSNCVCQDCDSGYKLVTSYNKCCWKKDNCIAYDSDCKCTECYDIENDGDNVYYLSTGHERCCAYITGCSTYNDNCSCATCQGGYDKSFDYGGIPLCCPKINNCTEYDEPESSETCPCRTCDAGYVLTAQKTCQQCDTGNCLTYNDNCTCATCASDRVMSTGASACCEKQAGCTSYDSSCKCTGVEDGYSVDSNGRSCPTINHCKTYTSNCSTCSVCDSESTKINNKCLVVCSQNSDCDATEFCAFPTASTSGSGIGVCTPTSTYTATSLTVNGRKWTHSTSSMNWYSAENWCKRQKASDNVTSLQMASLADLGCGSVNVAQHCTSSSSSFVGLRAGGWTTGYHWTRTVGRNLLVFEYGYVADFDKDYSNYALCTCPSIEHCDSFNSNCTCASCTAGHSLNGYGGCN